MKNTVASLALLCGLLVPSLVAAQVDIAGEWDHPGAAFPGGGGFHEETQDRGGGPDLGDYAGLPINDAVRFKASHYSPSWLTVPEHQCLPHPSTYQYRSPGGLSIIKEYDPVRQVLVAYRLYGSYGLQRTIWMDGRPRPPVNAPHTYDGFSLGRWEDDKLVVETTHIKYGFVRRNGVAHSDRVRMIENFMRHDNTLTIVWAVDDPLYFDEPFVRSSDYKLNPLANARLQDFNGAFADGGRGEVFFKCAPIEEVDTADRFRVPHYLPGTNTELNMFSRGHNVPMEAALGGVHTMYPEYMARVRQLVAGTAAAAPERQASQSVRSPNPIPEGVTSQHVAGQVWMVTAGGRNVAVQIGNEGVLVVDPGDAMLVEAVRAEVQKLAPNKAIRVIVNTSSDPALAGGNVRMGEGLTPQSQRAAIIAHENTGLRITQAGMSGLGIPTDTFFRGTREVYFNDEPIEVIHMPGAYSDGDAVVFFRKSDVIVAGHIIEDLTFPTFIAGGTLQGTIDALNKILLMTVASWRSQGGTLVIPVRGRPYDEGDVAEYRDMVTIIRDRLKDAMAKGRTLAQIKSDRLTRDYDGRYGSVAGPGSTGTFLDAAYQSLSAPPATN